MYASFYKHVRFSPIRKAAPPEILSRLEKCGFENFGGDLEVEIWLVRAARSMPEIALLKSMYTPEIRSALARILRRIEYEIFPAANVENFWLLYESNKMFPEYVAEFMNSVVCHKERFLENFNRHSERRLFDIGDG